MFYSINWKIAPEMRNQVQSRFMETGGPSPEGMTMHSRYHYVDGSGGFAILETDDPAALATLANDWSDILPIEIKPIASDDVIGGVIQAAAS